MSTMEGCRTIMLLMVDTGDDMVDEKELALVLTVEEVDDRRKDLRMP